MTNAHYSIRKKVQDVLAVARTAYPEHAIPTIPVTFSNRMTRSAGVYKYSTQFGKIINHEVSFSNPIIRDNDLIAFLNDTVIHEVAHYVDMLIFGSTGHNTRFYSVMSKLGHTNPKRCHSFKTTSNRSVQFKYECNSCGRIIEFSKTRHNKVLRGIKYTHNCGNHYSGFMKFVG